MACSATDPEFVPYGEPKAMRKEIQAMKSQWISERCPSGAKPSQCDDILQSGLHRCLKKNPSQKTKCIYNELYCTLFGGDACRY